MFCKICGNKILTGSKFCKKCGVSVSDDIQKNVETVSTRRVGMIKKIFIWITVIAVIALVAISFYRQDSKVTIQVKFTCPEDYLTPELADSGLEKFITDYRNEHPQSTVDDLLTYRYSLLVQNNCQKTLANVENYQQPCPSNDPLGLYSDCTATTISSNPNDPLNLGI